jgi:hypothetical protein
MPRHPFRTAAAIACALASFAAATPAYAQSGDGFGLSDRIRAGRARASAYALDPQQQGYAGDGHFLATPAPPPTLDIMAGDVAVRVPVGGDVRTGQGLVAETVTIVVNVQNGDNNVASNAVTPAR